MARARLHFPTFYIFRLVFQDQFTVIEQMVIHSARLGPWKRTLRCVISVISSKILADECVSRSVVSPGDILIQYKF